MKKVLIIILCVVVVILMFIFGNIIYLNNCDNFGGARLILKSDKLKYKIGDKISITAEIIPSDEEISIRIYDKIEYSLTISLTLIRYDENNPKFTGNYDNGITEIVKYKGGKSKISIIKISPATPFKRVFTGLIAESKDKSKYLIKFENYGQIFEIDKKSYKKSLNLRIHGFWMPIKPEPADSLDYYTNVIDIKIEDNK